LCNLGWICMLWLFMLQFVLVYFVTTKCIPFVYSIDLLQIIMITDCLLKQNTKETRNFSRQKNSEMKLWNSSLKTNKNENPPVTDKVHVSKLYQKINWVLMFVMASNLLVHTVQVWYMIQTMNKLTCSWKTYVDISVEFGSILKWAVNNYWLLISHRPSARPSLPAAITGIEQMVSAKLLVVTLSLMSRLRMSWLFVVSVVIC